MKYKKYIFGDEKEVFVEAVSLEQAISIYKATELFPENQLSYEQCIKREYNSITGRYDVVPKPGATITVYLRSDDPKVKDKVVGSIPLAECVDVNFDHLFNKQDVPMLGAGAPDSEKSTSTSLMAVESATDAQIAAIKQKSELRAAHDLIKKKEYELRSAMDQLHRSIAVIKNELQRKMKALYAIQTFFGVNEEIIQLRDGEPASEEEPLTLFQQVLYMDEEIGVWADGGIDYKDIDKFDAWISDNYKIFLHAPKSVCVFQIRREGKDYGDLISNLVENQYNSTTYFLIRNGDKLFRIWSDIIVYGFLFPHSKWLEQLLADYKGYSNRDEIIKEKMQSGFDKYVMGMIAIQGLIERTDVLGTGLRGKVNIMHNKLDGVVLVRDGEQEHWIGDGHKPWYAYCKDNASTIDVGSRVVLRRHIHVSGEHHGSRCEWRVSPFRTWISPSMREIHTIEEKFDKKESYHGTTWVIRYSPKDEKWDRYSGDMVERKRRVPCQLYSDEVLNFDAITLADVDWYQKNRHERRNYLDMLPVLHWIKKIKQEEWRVETGFVKLVLAKLGWEEVREPEVRSAIHWWKLKNKWKRNLLTDDAKAVRMIVKKLKSGEKYEEESKKEPVESTEAKA